MGNIMKNIRYYLLYQYNCILYRNKKVPVPFLEIWVGQFCNLKCKNCCHLIPYLEQKVYDMELLIEDCRKVFQWCEIEFFSIVGGEPFSHPHLDKLINFVAECPDIKKGKIVTNGTIFPNEDILNALKRLEGKLEIRIDGYPGIGIGVAEKFAEIMHANSIPYHFSRFNPIKPSSWKQLTPDHAAPLEKNHSKELFAKCNIRDCNTLADGELTLCPRGIGSECIFHIRKNRYEHVNVRGLNEAISAKAKIATGLDKTMYKNYCIYCLSLSEENDRYVKPGEQINSCSGLTG